MNKHSYLKAFKKSLRLVPKSLKTEIITEVTSIIEELEQEEKNLVQNLGSAEQLAQKYLEDLELPPSKVKRSLYLARNFFAITGIAIFSTISVFIMVFVYYSNYQTFAYHDQEIAKNQHAYPNEHIFTALPSLIELDHASLVMYHHQKSEAILKCKNVIDKKTISTIKRNACLLFAPNSSLKISVQQGELFLIQPTSDVEINAHQSKVNLLPANQEYNIQSLLIQSSQDTFASNPEADTLLRFQLKQSSLVRYDD